MDKIEAKIVYENSRESAALIKGFFTFLICTFVFILFAWDIGSDLGALCLLNCLLLIIILTNQVHMKSQKTDSKNLTQRIKFEYSSSSKLLGITTNLGKKYFCFKIKAEVQTRIPTTRFELDSKKFFCLKIINRKDGKETCFYELIEDKDLIPADIKTNPETKVSFSIPVGVERFPGPIFKLYNVLKENHLEND